MGTTRATHTKSWRAWMRSPEPAGLPARIEFSAGRLNARPAEERCEALAPFAFAVFPGVLLRHAHNNGHRFADGFATKCRLERELAADMQGTTSFQGFDRLGPGTHLDLDRARGNSLRSACERDQQADAPATVLDV